MIGQSLDGLLDVVHTAGKWLAIYVAVSLVVGGPLAVVLGRWLRQNGAVAQTLPTHAELRDRLVDEYGLDEDCSDARILQAAREHAPATEPRKDQP